MNGPDTDGFKDKMDEELGTLTDMKSWIIVKRRPEMNVFGSTWAFRIKQFSNGTINKLKVRLCICGNQQTEGVNVFNTFAPVVNFSTVCLLIVMSIQLGWTLAHIDYTAAFVNATVEEETYVGIPQGYKQEGNVLKLPRSLYGLKQSPRRFFNHLSDKLRNVGMVPSVNDPCLFLWTNSSVLYT
eukprot:1110292-Ditylum_brightwellii.AAC.1